MHPSFTELKEDTPVVVSPATGGESAPESLPAPRLEDRVQRLEEAVALLTHHVRWDDELDDARPIANLPLEPVPQSPETKPTPRAMPIPPPPTASLAEFSLPPLAEPVIPRMSAMSNVLRPLQNALPLAATAVNKLLPASSLWRDLWWDVRTAWRMLRDSYYPMSTACKVVPLFAVFYVTIWPWFSAWSGILGTIMNYFVNTIVLYIAFKVIQRELRRYYDFAEKYRR